ncbi:bile acid:sodium symporter family protein [Nocardia sp. NPDC005366]|uniref:bile acid:sodium symporter family protein n=1 Tax=Nocardia sp. NPDC005366 TaxID=3156878 RepID=UPI0033AAF352
MAGWQVTVALPIVLALIMFGLGLALTVDDFARVARFPKAVLIALGCQVLVLPAIAFGLVVLVDLQPQLAVGVMLLAASPGGVTANLLSHLFRGDVALNVTLTAVNSVLSVVTLPVLTNIALAYFAPAGRDELGLQLTKVLQVFAIVLVPVAVGMLTRRAAPDFARGMDRPVRIVSIGFLAIVTVAAVFAERANILDYLFDVGVVVLAFAVTSLALGFWVPAAAGVARAQAVACSMEIGIHNSTLAMTIAISVLDDIRMAVPAGVYGIAMLPIALVAGALMSRGISPDPAAARATAVGVTTRGVRRVWKK